MTKNTLKKIVTKSASKKLTQKKIAKNPARKLPAKKKSVAKKKSSVAVETLGSLKVGKVAPAFSLSGSDGKKVTLKEFKTKSAVVLYFYPKDNTPGCTIEACEFRDQYAKLLKRKAVVLGVSPDSLKRHEKFITKYDLPFRLLADEDHSLCEKYGIWVLRKFMGREYMGVQRTTVLIDKNGRVARLWSPVSPTGHAVEVLAALEELK